LQFSSIKLDEVENFPNDIPFASEHLAAQFQVGLPFCFRNSFIAGQNFLPGLVRPHSQFLRVPKLTPNLVAKVSRVSFGWLRHPTNIFANDWPFLQGGESTLMALIIR
jgi:hypothetical protein